MKRLLKYSSIYFLLTMIMAGCRQEKEILDLSEEPGSLVMYVSTGDGALGTKSGTPEGDYERGSGYENYIDIPGGDFRVWLFDSENRFVMEPSEIMLVPLEGTISDPFSKTYRLETIFNDEEWAEYKASFYGKEMKAVMQANWRRYPEMIKGETIDDLISTSENVMDYTPQSPGIDYERRIPYFGILTKQDPKITAGTALDAGKLHLLRALAKVEVEAGDGVPDITGVTLDKYNIRLNCAPAGVYSPADYVHDSWAQDYTSQPTVPPASEKHDSPFDFKKAVNGHYIAYIPEFRNIGKETSQRAGLNVRFDGLDKEYKVEFKDYKSGDPLDIMRNTWYRFRLRIGEVELDVQPYSSVELAPEFGLQRDEDGDLMVLPNDKGEYPAQFLEVYAEHIKKLDELGLKPDPENGDYYCIVRSPNDKRDEDLLCIKDPDCCRILENYHSWRVNCPSHFEERQVWQYRPRLAIDRKFYKDRQRDELLQHNNDHSIVCRSHEGYMVWKSRDGSKRIPVEAWDEITGNYWLEGETQYTEYNKDGVATGNVVKK